MSANEGLLSFLAEETEPDKNPVFDYWNILIVDDNKDVHQTTLFALKDIVVVDRKLRFFHAYSGKEGKQALLQHEDIAVVLLDVVMESEDAGLRLVEEMRNKMGLLNTQIILRTGQPGYAPEIETITKYEINDYKSKTELTRSKLFASVTTAVRSYNQLNRLEVNQKGLVHIIRANSELLEYRGMPDFTTGVLAQLASFIGVDNKGLVCALKADQNTPDASGYEIITASGHFKDWVSQDLSTVGSTKLNELLLECLSTQRNHLSVSGVCLYFNGNSGRRFAAYLEAPINVNRVDQELLALFGNNISLCAQNIELLRRLNDFAFIDPLTGLPNRNAFIRALDKQLATQAENLSVVLIDIDQFSATINMFGHKYGDEVLKAMAYKIQRLKESDHCFIARLAGDTFALFSDNTRDFQQKLSALLLESLPIKENQAHALSACMGQVRVDKGENTAEDLLNEAFVALKRAKHKGHRQFALFTQEMRDETQEHAKLLHGLYQHFERQHLFLVYQPQIRLEDEKVIGVEALIRWPIDHGQFISPDKFIPVAEQSGLIVDLGIWILRTALEALEKVIQQGHPEFRMAVNVSAVQFHHPEFVSMVQSALQQSAINNHQLELEITESVGVLGSDSVEQTIRALKNIDVSVSIDDFGTGFSSLSYLDQLSADRLKIDRSFVSALNIQNPQHSIAQTIIKLGHRLGMNVTAEGAETADQIAALKQLGCDEIQGYYYARPMPLAELINWINDRSKP